MPDVPAHIREQALTTPQLWSDGGRVHNWRNYVGERTRALWDTFTAEQKVALAADADDMAGNEDWE